MNAMYPMNQEIPETEIFKEKIRAFSEALARAAAQLMIDCGGGVKGQAAPAAAPEAAPEAAPSAGEAATPQAAARTTTEARFKADHFQIQSRKGYTSDFTPHEFFLELRSEADIPDAGGRIGGKKLQGAMLRVCNRNMWLPLTAKAVRYACYLHGCTKDCHPNKQTSVYIWFPPVKK